MTILIFLYLREKNIIIKQKKIATEIREITEAEFDQLLEEQTPQYQKWTDLEIKKIYIVTHTNMVTTSKGVSMVLVLKDNDEDVQVPTLHRCLLKQEPLILLLK